MLALQMQERCDILHTAEGLLVSFAKLFLLERENF